jgi:hypothetical protein
MTAGCATPIADDRLIDYWAHDLPEADASASEEHLFSCAHCSARLEAVASLTGGVAALARQGRISGIISRALLNRLQRAGVRIRQYTLDPGETVPCAAFPGDDVIVTAMNANLAGRRSVSLTVTGHGGMPLGTLEDVPVPESSGGILWATPAAFVRSMPSQQLRLAIRSVEGAQLIAEYALDHRNLGAE